MISSWDDEKKIITLKNFFPECYRFNKRCFSPFVVAIDYTLLYMIQSKQYIFTPDFILCYRKIDFKEANVLWKLMHVPDSASIDQIRKLVFDSRSYDSFRVCIQNTSFLCVVLLMIFFLRCRYFRSNRNISSLAWLSISLLSRIDQRFLRMLLIQIMLLPMMYLSPLIEMDTIMQRKNII